ncbi:hypothetical protein Ancab_013609 [Ancistrocladus abbreviatus]
MLARVGFSSIVAFLAHKWLESFLINHVTAASKSICMSLVPSVFSDFLHPKIVLGWSDRHRRELIIMATEQNEGQNQQSTGDVAVGFGEMIEDRFRKLKEDAETYPYVWASYILVYGGFALWTTYRWRKLRKTEDRVRALQERLRKLVEAEESTSSAASTEKAPAPPIDKPVK